MVGHQKQQSLISGERYLEPHNHDIMTVFLTILILFLGGEVTKALPFAMLGVITGTYSSICVALLAS
jgi:hypothetical protein